jgi:hypothetical protein
MAETRDVLGFVPKGLVVLSHPHIPADATNPMQTRKFMRIAGLPFLEGS